MRCMVTKETYIYAQKRCIYTKEAYMVLIRTRMLCLHKRDMYIRTKETSLLYTHAIRCTRASTFCCSILLQRVAAQCFVLQCVAVCVLQCAIRRARAWFSVGGPRCVAVCCSALHCVALCCTVLHCSMLQRVVK